MFQDELARWAGTKRDQLLQVAEATGAVEGWIRGEAVLALKTNREIFGKVDDVRAEQGRIDLSLRRGGKSISVEFKVVFNNKNLVRGHNGAKGILRDIQKLSRNMSFDEKYIAVFLAFFSRRAYPLLDDAYGRRNGHIWTQPGDDEEFEPFAADLADKVVREVVSAPGRVHVLGSEPWQWLGFWSHQVT